MLPAVELNAPDEPGAEGAWAPVTLDEPLAPLGPNKPFELVVPAGTALSRTVQLDRLRWNSPHSEVWPAKPLAEVEPGRYRASFTMEILGGNSWSFECGGVLNVRIAAGE